jgi:transposase
MTFLPPNVKVHLAYGYTDMRKVFRGRKANLIKIVFWDGTGLCLFTKRLEHGVFLWPSNIELGRTLALTSAQLSALLEGIDWRSPERQWRPAVAG